MVRYYRRLSLVLLLGAMTLGGCGGSQKAPTLDNPFTAARIGTDATLEVMTWNIENFPKAGTITADHVADAIAGLDVDVVALQEIVSAPLFQRVVDQLDGWDGYRADSASGSDQNLAFIYRTDGLLEVTAIYEILAGNSRPLPRRPLVLEGTIGGELYVIINNHFKCCGDGLLDLGDSGDEETRRYNASLLLQQYVAAHYADRRVIIVGDFNDEITDVPPNNVFQNFLDAPDQWLFTDMPIAQNDNTLWSYPSWHSHIDHVLINVNTFADFAADEASVQVLPLQNYVGGMGKYNEEITDHLPVAVVLVPQPSDNPFLGARVGTSGTLEVATWNLGNFGDGEEETAMAAQAIEALDADVVALQEVISPAQFAALDVALTDWTGVLGTSSSANINLGVLYRSDGTVGNPVVTELFPDEDLAFTRAPLMLEATFLGQPFVVINVHHKCCGDGILDTEDPLDEENRRLQSNLLLKDYITANHPDARVLVVGDFNDSLDDPFADNVFLDFLLADDQWEFADLDIATGPSAGWSMPGFPAHVDHILVSNELFSSLTGPNYLIEVSPLGDYLPGGLNQYLTTLSDHLPEVVRLEF